MNLGFGNNIRSTLAADINATQTTITVMPGTGAQFAKTLMPDADLVNPSVDSTYYSKLTLTDAQETVFEICHLLSVNQDTLTVIRGQEGTFAKGWSLGDVASNFATRGSENNFVQIEDLQNGRFLSANAGGTENALTVSIPSMFYINNQNTFNLRSPITIFPQLTNTGPCTLQLTVSSMVIGTFRLVKGNNLDLFPGDIVANAPFIASFSPDLNLFVMVNPARGIINDTGWLKAENNLSDVDSIDTARENLSVYSKEEVGAPEAPKLFGYRARGLWQRLSDFFAVEDFGDTTDFTGGVKSETLTKVIVNTVSSVLLRFGHVGISKKLFGSKTNGAVLSVKGTSGDPSFTPEVVNVSGSQGWADYNLADAVTFYSDIRIGQFENWEIVDSPVYSVDGFTAAGLDFSKIFVGMTVRTRHATPCWAFITGVSALSNKVYVDRWSVKDGTAGIIPAAGIGLYINPIDKAWAANFNLIIPADTRLSQNSGGVIAEFGLQNKGIATPVALNGLHITLLNGSAYGGTAAINITGVQNLRWVYGSRISGVSTAMWSSGNSRAVVSAGDGEGSVFYGCVTFSDVIRNGSAVGEVLAARDGLGRIVRQPWVVNAANGNYAISAFGGATLHGTLLPGHIYYLPTLKNKGDHVPIYNPFFGSSLTIQTSDGETIHHPDGTISTSITVFGAQDITAVYLYDGWYLIGVNQNQTAANGTFPFSSSYISANTVNGISLPLNGAAMGMMVAVSCSVDTGNLMITGRVSASGVVTINIFNPTVTSINIPSCNFNVRAFYSS